jgi:hypothetical protein
LRHIQIGFILRLMRQFTQITSLPSLCNFVFERSVVQAPQPHGRNVGATEVGVQACGERKRWDAALQMERIRDGKWRQQQHDCLLMIFTTKCFLACGAGVVDAEGDIQLLGVESDLQQAESEGRGD